ncbi:glycoside hydrolase family 5 protein [Anaerosacchariphilus polymeriproducens]|uniref:Glycoside hydrolase family 5 protein n=1 Tax=Anaerosacchariphilus polymeriproducens TaxID=1812858 RepID=A0A371AWY6_9FIRM|nr:glycoside hydrolase family 5 protein [Anaerosacchariphilus polymeriproducens]RDU24059.1 glycoside hydrolase family 5 protein [Anaerosacchariphilus polymeriproducens]
MSKNGMLRFVLAILFTVSSFLGFLSTEKGNIVMAAEPGFHVNGTKLYDANGKAFVMRGVNYPHAWYRDKYQTAIPAIASKGFNSVRIVLSDGQQWGKTSLQEINTLVEYCKRYKMIAVLEVHDATGSDDFNKLNQTVNYWKEMKRALIGNEKYVILNIANEWYGTWDDGNNWKNGYISAIRSLRNEGIKNTIMVDCAGWGQQPKSIFDHGKEVANADNLRNTMFAIHMYEYAGGNADTVYSNISNVLNQNLCLSISEFGGYHTNGDVDEDAIMRCCQEKGVGWQAWSWTGNSGNLSFLDLSKDWEGKNLTEFGQRIIFGANGVKSTSQICSVFK